MATLTAKHLLSKKTHGKLKFQTVWHQAVQVTSQQVNSVTANILDLVMRKIQAQSCRNCGDVLSSVANKELDPLKDEKGSQLTVAHETEPITAQRRTELEHYLKLKRFRTVFFVCLLV